MTAMAAAADIGHAVQFYREEGELFDTVGVFGEMLSLLWNRGALWDDSHADALSAVCRLHSAVLGHFPNDVRAPGKARRLVGDALVRWGHEQELSESIALVVSELATNAVTHARSAFSVLARSDDQVIRDLGARRERL